MRQKSWPALLLAVGLIARVHSYQLQCYVCDDCDDADIDDSMLQDCPPITTTSATTITTTTTPITTSTTPQEVESTTPEYAETTSTTPGEVETTSTTPEDVETTSTTPEEVESTTPEEVETTTTTPADLETTSTTPEVVETTSTTPEVVETTSTTPEDVETTSTTPEDVETTSTIPEEVESTTSEDVETTSTTPADVETTSTTPEDVETTSTTPADVETTSTTSQSSTSVDDSISGEFQSEGMYNVNDGSASVRKSRLARSISMSSAAVPLKSPAQFLINKYRRKRAIRLVDEDGTSYHCYKVTVKDGEKTKISRGCVTVPEENAACDVLNDRYGNGNVENCITCPNDKCNHSSKIEMSLTLLCASILGHWVLSTKSWR